jgi:transcriptional regulator with XRE-family HTH domain
MSNNLSRYQILKGLTDQQVADKSKLDLSYYNRVKNGRIVPRVDMALRIARVLERSVHTLWELDEE